MWPLGHAAVGYLLYSIAVRVRGAESPSDLPAIALLVGTQFPDLVDKPLSWHVGLLPTGRTLAHSLLVLVPLCLVLYRLARSRRRGDLGVAFAIGAISHVVVDAIPTLWESEQSAAFLLYPVLSVDPYESGAPAVTELFFQSLSNPWFHLEFVLAVLAVVSWSRDGYPGLDRVGRLVRHAVGRDAPRTEAP